MEDFAAVIRGWRRKRHLSQLDLALSAEVSARHISFLESRRAKPSRQMVLRLAEVLEMPRRDRNMLLTSAGFASHYPSLPLDDAAMAQVRAAMEWMISRHAPYPALVMDRLWRLVAINAPAALLMGSLSIREGDSLLDVLCAPDGLRRHIENWPEIGYHTMTRLRMESARAGGIAALDRAAQHLAGLPEIANWRPPPQLPAVVPAIYRAGDLRLSLFSTFAQFSTAEDVALAEMKIEMMFPADPATESLLKALPTAGD